MIFACPIESQHLIATSATVCKVVTHNIASVRFKYPPKDLEELELNISSAGGIKFGANLGFSAK